MNHVLRLRDAATGEFVQVPAIVGPKGDTGEKGDTGDQGNPGPNEVSTLTSTAFTGLIKGSGGKAAQAVPGTDYIQAESDPTVPAWAKAASKPTYTAAEVGAVPTSRTVNTKALSSNITLSASDVGAEVSGAVDTHNSSGSAHSTQFNAKQDKIATAGILKGAGSGSVSAATAGTDYALPAVDYTASLSTTWSGTGPYTQNVTITGLESTAKIEVGLASNATAAQYDGATKAMLHCSAQAANQITVTAFGEKPTVTIPIIVRSV